MVWADGRRYDGEWLENRCNGRGVLTYKDGRRYEGEYKLDKMHGKGVYIWAEGARYEGEYKEHKKHGRGLQTWPTGGRYEGQYVDGTQTGLGIMTWADGRRYEGEWLDGKCTGKGTTTFKSGSRYVGVYHEDKMNGSGIYTFADGRKYEGEYRNNMKNGHGVYTWADEVKFDGQWTDGKPTNGVLRFPDGTCCDKVKPRTGMTNDETLQKLYEDAWKWKSCDQEAWKHEGAATAHPPLCGFHVVMEEDGSRYEGEWVDNKKTGKGKMVWADGRVYDGTWLENRYHGRGTLTYKDGRRYVGEYMHDAMHGEGIYTWADGARYEGEYQHNRKHGRGTQIWSTGGKYVGEYKDGTLTGRGVMTWADGKRYEGEWRHGKCTGNGVLTHADGRRYEGYYLKDKMHGHGVYTWPDGRRYNGEYKNNLKHGNGIWTWPDGVMLEGQWADNLPCRHACTIIFSSYVSTTEVQPRVGLDTDTTLQKLWEDAHAWRQEHNVVHETRRSSAAVPAARVAEVKEEPDGDEVAPRGAAVASVSTPPQSAADGARSGAPGDYIQGANSASVDVGRSADQSTEMFRALRSVAMQLDQGLAEMEDIQSVLDEQTESSHAGMGPAASKVDGNAACGPTHSVASNHSTAKLLAIRDKLVQQVQMLHLELDRHGGAERLVASASKGAGSADAGDNDEFPAAAPALREMSLREMSLDEVCEAMASRGLSRYIEAFRAAGLDGAQLSEMDEPRLAQYGVALQDRAAILAL